MQVYNPVVATAYPERMLNEYQKSATARDFLIKGLTIPATLLLSDVSFFSGSAATWKRFVMISVDEFVVHERMSQ